MNVCKLYKGTLNGTIMKTKQDWKEDMWINVRNSLVVNHPHNKPQIGHITTITDFEVQQGKPETNDFKVHKLSEYEKELTHIMFECNYHVPTFINSFYEIEEIYERPDVSIWFILEVLHPCFMNESNYVVEGKDFDDEDTFILDVLDVYYEECNHLLSKSNKLTCDIVKKYSKMIEWDMEYISSNPVLDIDEMIDSGIQVKLKYLLTHPKLTKEHFKKYNLEWYALNCACVLRSCVDFLEPYRVKYNELYLKQKKTN